MPPSPRGVSYRIDSGGRRKRITVNAFAVKFHSGHVGFFRRIGGGSRKKIIALSGKRKGKKISSQASIAELLGPSIPHVAQARPEFQKLLKVDAGERLALMTARETNFFLSGSSKGGEGHGG